MKCVNLYYLYTASKVNIKEFRNYEKLLSKKIPMDEYIAYQELMVEADDVWHRAKETNDFELFRPVLDGICKKSGGEKRYDA